MKSSLSDEEWMIRARVLSDLEELKNAAQMEEEVLVTFDSDYRYRLVITYNTLQRVMSKLGEIDYSNFKGKIGVTQSQRHKLDAYHRIWSIMYELQKTDESTT